MFTSLLNKIEYNIMTGNTSYGGMNDEEYDFIENASNNGNGFNNNQEFIQVQRY